MTKADLADITGVSRVTLYLCMECKDRSRLIEPTDRVREAVDEALNRSEAAVIKLIATT